MPQGQERTMESLANEAEKQRQREFDAVKRQRRGDAIGLASNVADERVKNPRTVMPDVFGFLATAVEGGGQLTDYETSPLLRALLAKGSAGKVDEARMELLLGNPEAGEEGLDARIEALRMDPLVQSAITKNVEAEILADEVVDMTLDEERAFAEYSGLVEERRWVLEQMTNGMFAILDEKDALTERIRKLEIYVSLWESREGSLSDDERERYDELMIKRWNELDSREENDYKKLKDKKEEDFDSTEEMTWNRLREKMNEGLSDDELDEFEGLELRAGDLTDKEKKQLEKSRQAITTLGLQVVNKDALIEEAMQDMGSDVRWYELYKAVNAVISVHNVTEQHIVAWHDLKSGAVNNFVDTWRVDSLTPSDMVALLETKGIGSATEKSFRAISVLVTGGAIGVDGEIYLDASAAPDSAYKRNVLQEEKLKESDMVEFFEAVGRFVSRDGRRMGINDLYKDLGIKLARDIFEHSMLSGWFGVLRDDSGEIMYANVDAEGKPIGRMNSEGEFVATDVSSDFGSEAYKYGLPAKMGDMTFFPEHQNDYVKLVAPRAKMMKDYAAGFKTGLPALMPVLPDTMIRPLINPADVYAIARGDKKLVDCYKEKKENFFWSEKYGQFRAEQVFESVISEFLVGAKGFRGIADEIELFLSNPTDLADLNKKIMVALGEEEGLRFKANMVMAIFYAVVTNMAPGSSDDEFKAVVPDSLKGKWLSTLNQYKDDYARVFVRTGFLDTETWEDMWDNRMREIGYGEGGKRGIGLYKRGESVPTKQVARVSRRKIIANQV